jgi:very-short-patch-repair endonuclease
MSHDEIYDRSRGGSLHRLHRGVYAVGHRALSTRGRYMAAVLACGRQAALSHRSAAHLWDLRAASGRAEVTMPRGCAGPAGVTVHRSRMLEARDATVREGIPVTTVARTLLDLAGQLHPRQLATALDRAERLDLFDLDAVEDLLVRARGKRGAKALREAIAGYRPLNTRSELEVGHWQLLRDAGLPEPELNVLVDGERQTHEVDALWRDRRLIVELDGFAFHRTRQDRARDAYRDADLELAGFRVVRLTWDDVTRGGDRTIRRLGQILL